MAGTSTFFGNGILNLLRGVAFTAPSAVYLALYNGDPEAAGTEVTTTIRAAGRPQVSLSASTAKQTQNSADIDFGNSAGNATITHFALFDAVTGGNMLIPKQISAQRQVAQGDPVKYAAGALVFKI